MKLLPSYKQRLGKLGEQIAASYLQKHGFRIIEHNFKVRYGEIDIICLKDQTLVFVEVKARVSKVFGAPEESVTAKKLKEVIKTAEYYKTSHSDLPEAMRIDVIGIELDKKMSIVSINHITNATM